MLNKGWFQKGDANITRRLEIREKISLALQGRKRGGPLPEKLTFAAITASRKSKPVPKRASQAKENRKRQVFAVWVKTKSVTLAGKELGISKQRVHQILNY